MSDNNVQRCLACGAPLDAPVQGGKVKCKFCGGINIVHAHEKKKGDDIVCPECGAANPKNALHCGRCGIKLEFICPKCAALNSYGTVYCVQCGVDIQAEIKLQQEEEQRQQEEGRRTQEEIRQLFEEEKKRQKKQGHKQLMILVVVIVILVLMSFVFYVNTNYSPAAKSTKTAMMGQTVTAEVAAYRVLFYDDFSDITSGWATSSPGEKNVFIGYENGGFRIHPAANMDARSYIGKVFPEDVRIEVQATRVGGPDDINAFGIFCRLDTSSYYYFVIASNGLAAIIKKSDDTSEIISSGDGNWSPAPSIYPGNATNDIRADCIGDTLALYVNGTQVVTATDDTFTGGGVGLEAGTFGTGGTDILFDNFAVYGP